MMARSVPRGQRQTGPRSGANITRADPDPHSFPFPPKSVLQPHLDQIQETQARPDALDLISRIFLIFFFLLFLIPMLAIGLMMGNR